MLDLIHKLERWHMDFEWQLAAAVVRRDRKRILWVFACVVPLLVLIALGGLSGRVLLFGLPMFAGLALAVFAVLLPKKREVDARIGFKFADVFGPLYVAQVEKAGALRKELVGVGVVTVRDLDVLLVGFEREIVREKKADLGAPDLALQSALSKFWPLLIGPLLGVLLQKTLVNESPAVVLFCAVLASLGLLWLVTMLPVFSGLTTRRLRRLRDLHYLTATIRDYVVSEREIPAWVRDPVPEARPPGPPGSDQPPRLSRSWRTALAFWRTKESGSERRIPET